MKKLYEVPELEIIRFTIQTSVLAGSVPAEGNVGGGNNGGGNDVDPTLPTLPHT